MAATIQEIGVPIDLSKGYFKNMVYVNGALQLQEIRKDDNGVSLYPSSGFWESEPVYIKDKITTFKNVAKNITVKGSGTYKIYTSSSPDGEAWVDYQPINTDGSVNSPKDSYVKLKVEVFAGETNATITVDEFTEQGKYTNPYVNSDTGALEIKKIYSSSSEKDNSWTDSGVLFVNKVQKSNFKKLDMVKVEVK
ncbi:hypothetical protein [Paenibacillus tuaregi]|uniref:hypothetical protein n=1 Tax=Paenibacillus tuaregi TaxID=1816681 RepID=UPI000837C436|nr:hypothetical protein [Paenibacillus tuaregi]